MTNYKEYLDEFGEPTYYVQNVSNGHVVLSDLGIVVPIYQVKDLREDTTIEELKKSSSLRQALNPKYNMLKRLTVAEYEKLLKEQLSIQEKLEAKPKPSNPSIADEDGQVKEVKADISPKCQSMVEKLKLYYKEETRDKGIPPEQFLIWLQNYKPTDDETEYMLSVIGEKSIRKLLLEKSNPEIKDKEVEEEVRKLNESSNPEDSILTEIKESVQNQGQ